MRILNLNDSTPLSNITVYLTPAEATQMIGYLEQLSAERGEHFHLNDDVYQREITLTVYQEEHLDGYDERSKKLILTGN